MTHTHHDHHHGGAALPAAGAAPVVREWLDESDRVLVTAGAGLSAAAGYDYNDDARFAQLFPFMTARGYRARYEVIGAPLPPALLWGYWASHVADIRFDPRPAPIYQQLRDLVGDREHFVMTSNVDALFARNGFDPDRAFTPQGDYARLQCQRPCTRDTWEWRPLQDAILADLDPATGHVQDPALIPACPRCGGEVFLNVNLGRNYIQDPYVPAGQALVQWLAAAPEQRLVVLEIGAGYNTPGVIRWPGEAITARTPGARLIRINPTHPEVSGELGDRALSVGAGAAELFATL